MTSAVEEYWTTLVPAIGGIQKTRLRTAVCHTWQASMERSAYADVRDVPQSPFLPDRSLLCHVNDVCVAAAKLVELSDDLFASRPDTELTMAAAILHDVDKPLLYQRAGSSVTYTDGYSHADHGPVGADLGRAHGVPESVAELVCGHSPFRTERGLPGTVEGAIVYYADLVSADLSMVAAGTAPFHALMRYVPR